MKKILFLSAASLAMLSFSGCSDDINYETGDGEGRLLVTASLKSDVKVEQRSRAAVTDDELAKSAIIWIANEKGVVRDYKDFNTIPAEGIMLASGNYKALAWAGDSVSASFDKKYFRGEQQFTIGKGETVQIDLECKIVNTVVEVRYDEAVDNGLSDYVMKVSNKAGELTFNGRDDEARPGYFMIPSFDPDLTCTLTGTLGDGSEYTWTHVIENAKRGTKYVINVVNRIEDPEEIGGALFDIVVDETEIVVEDNLTISSAPIIEGLSGFDLATPIVGEEGKLEAKKLWIRSIVPFKAVEISCPAFVDMLGIGGADFEVFGMQQSVADALTAKGFSYQLFTHADEADAEARDFQEMKLVFDDAFMNLFPKGEHRVTIKATDQNGRVGVASFDVVLTDAMLKTEAVPADAPTTWATQATVTGTVMKDGVANLGFNYRKLGTQQWSSVSVDAAAGLAVGDTFSAELTGLEPGATYEYQAFCDGFVADVQTFDTEAAAQLPNAGFEEWNTSDIPYLIGDRSFWDSGNHGSATLKQNVTVPDESIKHGGNYSIKLESAFPNMIGIGKFAAGNVFTGRYLDTNGTDGELGWGRPFTSRPKALRGYVKYTSKEVDCNGGTQNKPQGYQDQGIIYIAMLDGHTEDFTTTKTKERYTEFPVIIQTKGERLFDKTADNVIAYGEKVLDTTPGDGMIEFEIPLEYFKTDIKAAHIMVVASSSKQGDYFIGGKGSTMWLDDLELVY